MTLIVRTMQDHRRKSLENPWHSYCSPSTSGILDGIYRMERGRRLGAFLGRVPRDPADLINPACILFVCV